jgi:hypothetical protein
MQERREALIAAWICIAAAGAILLALVIIAYLVP